VIQHVVAHIHDLLVLVQDAQIIIMGHVVKIKTLVEIIVLEQPVQPVMLVQYHQPLQPQQTHI